MAVNGQDHLHEASMIQRLALYATLGFLMDALGQTWEHWGFWCVLALFWAVDTLSRNEGFDDAMELNQALLIKSRDMLAEAQQRLEQADKLEQDKKDSAND